MSIQSYDKTFGSNNSNEAGNSKKDLPKAQFWINIGYVVEVEGENGTEHKFISLPMGIPLDTQEHLPTNSSNADFRALRSAQNDLLDQLKAEAEKLEPGQEVIIGEGALVIQVRRVKAEQAPITASENKFARKLFG